MRIMLTAMLTIILIDGLEARLMDLIEFAKVSNNRFGYQGPKNKPLYQYDDEFYDVVGITGCNFVVDQF